MLNNGPVYLSADGKHVCVCVYVSIGMDGRNIITKMSIAITYYIAIIHS